MEPTVKTNTDYIVHVTDDWECVGEGELVRCKDCVYYRPYSGGNGRYDCDNMYGMADVYEDGFCSRAERKEE